VPNVASINLANWHTYSNPKLDNVAASRAPHGSRRCRPQCRHRDPGMNPARQQAVSTEQCRDIRRTRRACRMVRSAPDSSSSRTISTFPLAAAKCSGVAPDLKGPRWSTSTSKNEFSAIRHVPASSVDVGSSLDQQLGHSRVGMRMCREVEQCELGALLVGGVHHHIDRGTALDQRSDSERPILLHGIDEAVVEGRNFGGCSRGTHSQSSQPECPWLTRERQLSRRAPTYGSARYASEYPC